MRPAIVPIVEGHSELHSVPILLRRLLHGEGIFDLDVARPFRVQRSRVVRPGELEKALTFATRFRERAAGIVLLLDADDDCPAVLGAELAKRSHAVTELPTLVALANREFEGWLLGAKESLRGVRGIRDDATSPEDPESIRGAKERLTKNMTIGRRYLEVDDQPALTTHLDLESAQARCPSFARFARKLSALASRLTGG